MFDLGGSCDSLLSLYQLPEHRIPRGRTDMRISNIRCLGWAVFDRPPCIGDVGEKADGADGPMADAAKHQARNARGKSPVRGWIAWLFVGLVTLAIRKINLGRSQGQLEVG